MTTLGRMDIRAPSSIWYPHHRIIPKSAGIHEYPDHQKLVVGAFFHVDKVNLRIVVRASDLRQRLTALGLSHAAGADS